MKKRLILLIMTIIVACASRVYAQDVPEASFDKTVVDFDVFTEDNPRHKAVFTIKNIGKAPLIIVRVRATCGCTTPTYTKAPIMPGDTGTITVDYNGNNRAIGPFSKTIMVTTNASDEQVRLQIKGNMQPSKRE